MASKGKTAKRTDEPLWRRIVKKVTREGRGGRPGQWSARKAQLAVHLYKQAGGDYVGPKSKDLSLAKWTRQRWRTKSGKPSLKTGERYLPAKAISALSEAEYAATSREKRRSLGRGEQFSRQPESIARKVSRYRRNATEHSVLGVATVVACVFGSLMFADKFWP